MINEFKRNTYCLELIFVSLFRNKPVFAMTALPLCLLELMRNAPPHPADTHCAQACAEAKGFNPLLDSLPECPCETTLSEQKRSLTRPLSFKEDRWTIFWKHILCFFLLLLGPVTRRRPLAAHWTSLGRWCSTSRKRLPGVQATFLSS